MRCKDDVKERSPLNFDYEGMTIFDPWLSKNSLTISILGSLETY